MKGVVITTSKYTAPFLKDCLDSIKKTPYRILVVSNDGYDCREVVKNFHIESYKDVNEVDLVINPVNGWEIAGIKAGQEHFTEFVHIMDTTVLKDISLFDKAFAIPGHVVFTKGNFHYMGKFVSKELPNLPIVRDKVTAIMMETIWLDKFTEFEPDLPVHSLEWIEIHGQKRMVIQNEYMQKFKGTVWISPSQLAELEQQELDKINKDKSSK